MHTVIDCIVPDGSAPTDGTLARVPEPATVYWPIGDSGTITLNVMAEDGSAYDTTGTTITLVCREHVTDADPLFAALATVGQLGVAPVPILPSYTEDMVSGRFYWFDVRMAEGSNAYHILPMSKWIPSATVARSGEPASP